MNWWVTAKNKSSLADRIKKKVQSSPFFLSLFKRYNVDLEEFSSVKIKEEELDGIFCKTDGDEIIVDPSLVDDNLLGEHFHFIAHEVYHWLRRQREKQHYFADPEEVQSFDVAIAYALSQWSGRKDIGRLITKNFLPLVKITIPDTTEAISFLKERIKAGRALLADMKI